MFHVERPARLYSAIRDEAEIVLKDCEIQVIQFRRTDNLRNQP